MTILYDCVKMVKTKLTLVLIWSALQPLNFSRFSGHERVAQAPKGFFCLFWPVGADGKAKVVIILAEHDLEFDELV